MKNIHKRAGRDIFYSMRKFALIFAAVAAAAVATVSACTRETDYSDYISEERFAIYMYEDDDIQIKIYCSNKESPFIADGVKGDVSALVEIYATLGESYETVNVSGESVTGGEMSYMSVKDCWYLSYGGEISGSEISITLDADGTAADYTLVSVAGENVMPAEKALGCVREHDGKLFESLTRNGIFNGEIFIRLLYDENCYYYVGVCDNEGDIHAYLVDAVSGRIIAERKYKA